MSFALTELDASAIPPLEEAILRARRVVGPATGIVRRVVLEDCPVDGPRSYIACTEPAEAEFTLGTKALNLGMAVSADRDRALMKAVGESIERYCGAFPGAPVVLTKASALEGAVAPERFQLFAPRQYEDGSLPFRPFDEEAVVGWVEGTSLSSGRPAYVPACMVYVPYQAMAGEAQICDRISTGLACAHSRSSALGKGILEVIERDALMLTWHNRLAAPRIRLESIDDPFVAASLDMFSGMAVEVNAYCLTMDVGVPVILGVARSMVDATPHTVVGLGTALDPARAVALALEEVALGVWGVRVNAAHRESEEFKSFEALGEFESLEVRGVAYATRRELAANMDFLAGGPDVTISELPRVEAGDPLEELRALTQCLSEQGLEPIGCDLTTEDIDDVGFKVCRVVVPGMRPLDIRHSRRHLGGGRLYEVPVALGRLPRPRRMEELNQDPHPFP